MLTTSVGPTAIRMPRTRVVDAPGTRAEWQSQVIPRYQRRTARVDEAILGVYLSGANSRRIRGALAPLLQDGPLSKDAVSRLVGRLKADFEQWRARDLAETPIRYLFLDGWYPKVRLGKRRVTVPVLVVLGVRADGQRELLDLRLVGDEYGGLAREHPGPGRAAPRDAPLAVIDGSAGQRRRPLNGTGVGFCPASPPVETSTFTLRSRRNAAASARRSVTVEEGSQYAPNRRAGVRQRRRCRWITTEALASASPFEIGKTGTVPDCPRFGEP